MPWYTLTDSFDTDFGLDEWHGTNAFIRDGAGMFRTYFINNRGDEAMGSTWSYLDITALGRQEEWEDSWKAHHLACCRETPGCGSTRPADTATAWRYGLRLGLHCTYCCAGMTAILLVLGVMDLRAMAVVASAITAERLAPAGVRVARGIGIVAVGAGLVQIARAAALG